MSEKIFNKIFKKRSVLYVDLMIVFILLLVGSSSVVALEWSEIMFNPLGTDNGGEYVELQGIESLNGCTISDSASTDKLVLYHAGDVAKGVIVITENDSLLFDEFISRGATVYTAGSAIGNGLGNTNETLSVQCGVPNASQNLLLHTAYDVHDFVGIKEGYAIVYDSTLHEWKIGVMNGTPGILEFQTTHNNDVDITHNTNTSYVNSTYTNVSNNSSNNSIVCTDKLQLFTSKNVVTVGDVIIITALSPSYTEIEALDDIGNVLLFKDTLQGNVFTLSAPNTAHIKITAKTKLCGGEQRMIRTVIVKKPLVIIEEHSSQILLKSNMNNNVDDVKRNSSKNITTSLLENVISSSTDSPTDVSELENPLITKQSTALSVSSKVVYDANANILPWISLFGVVTMISCTIIFFVLYKNKQI